jgi:hypothetical protein
MNHYYIYINKKDFYLLFNYMSSNKFGNSSLRSRVIDPTNGSLRIRGRTLDAINLKSHLPCKTGNNGTIETKLLDITDVDQLTEELNTINAKNLQDGYDNGSEILVSPAVGTVTIKPDALFGDLNPVFQIKDTVDNVRFSVDGYGDIASGEIITKGYFTVKNYSGVTTAEISGEGDAIVNTLITGSDLTVGDGNKLIINGGGVYGHEITSSCSETVTWKLPPTQPPLIDSFLRINNAGVISYDTHIPTLQEVYDNGISRTYGYIENNSNIGQVTIKASSTWRDISDQFTVENELGQTQLSVNGLGRLESKSLYIENDSIFGNGSAGIDTLGDTYVRNLQTENVVVKNGKTLTIKSNTGNNTVISAPTTSQNINLQLPTSQATSASRPVISDTLGNLGYNDQELLTTSDVHFNSVQVNGENIDAVTVQNVSVHSDVNIITPIENEILQYKTGVWTNKSLADSGIADRIHTHVANDVTDFSGAVDARITAANGVTIASLDGSGKVPISQLSLSNMSYCGTWDASANIPPLASGVGTPGCYRVVTVSGTTNIDGSNNWEIGDWIIFNGVIWEKFDNTDGVSSVAGKLGAVQLVATDLEDIDSAGSGSIITAGERQQIVDSTGSLKHKGFWNASTNVNPTLIDFQGVFGDCYIVSVAGSTTLGGHNNWKVGDWVYYDTISQWRRLPYQTVISVNGDVGDVSITAGDFGITQINSGQIITTVERDQITTNETNITNLTGNVGGKTLQDAYNNSPDILTVNPVSLKTTSGNPVMVVKDALDTTNFNLHSNGDIFTNGNIKAAETSQSIMKLINNGNSQRIGLTIPAGLAATYDLKLPQTLATTNNLPVISDTLGNLSYNDQELLSTSDVNFNKVILAGDLEANSGTISTFNMIVNGETRVQNSSSGNPLHYTCLGSNSVTNYCLKFPSGLPIDLRPLQSDANGNLSYTNQSLQQNDDVKFNSLLIGGTSNGIDSFGRIVATTITANDEVQVNSRLILNDSNDIWLRDTSGNYVAISGAGGGTVQTYALFLPNRAPDRKMPLICDTNGQLSYIDMPYAQLYTTGPGSVTTVGGISGSGWTNPTGFTQVLLSGGSANADTGMSLNTIQNRITYAGGPFASTASRLFKVSYQVSATIQSGNNDSIGFMIVKNGTVAVAGTYTRGMIDSGGDFHPFSGSGFISLSQNEYVEVWTANHSSTQSISLATFNFMTEGVAHY